MTEATEGALISGRPGGAALKRRTVRLASLRGVRQEMSRVYRSMVNGELESSEGARLIYSLVAIGKVLEAEVLESRIAALEAATEDGL